MGLQALILCGPGTNLETLSTPDEPKALLQIANRPMVWYAIDWCHRAGVSDIHLVTSPAYSKAIESALAQNPHLTSLSPKPTVLAPEVLDDVTPTGTILTLHEIEAAISGDFLVLPCDLICELPAESLIETWLLQQDDDFTLYLNPGKQSSKSGLGVWYDTRTEQTIKKTETDFLITAPLPKTPVPSPPGSLRPHLSQLVNTMTTDTLNDKTVDRLGEPKPLSIRASLIEKHPRTRILNAHRDAHIYIFPHWMLSYARSNPHLDTISEDLVAWWAKATWQPGLAQKLQLPFATPAAVPPILAYIHPSPPPPPAPSKEDSKKASSTPMSAKLEQTSAAPFILRADTPHQLLLTSLHLATFTPPHPFSHPQSRSPQASIPPNTTITDATSLIGPFTTIAPQSTVRDTVIGANCEIGSRVRLTRCLVMDGAKIEDGAVLVGTVVGKGAKVGKKCNLAECVVQGGMVVEEGTEGKGETFMGFEEGGRLEDEGEIVEEEVRGGEGNGNDNGENESDGDEGSESDG